MRYITTGERIGYERGVLEGEQAIILKQLKRRIGELSPEIQQCIQSFSINQLETLSEALLDFNTRADLFNWLETN